MLRADITRADLRALKIKAIADGKTVQALVGEMIRRELGRAA